MGPGLTRICLFVGKISQKFPYTLLIPCVFCLYTLLKLVSYYDLSVLPMSVIGFQKKEVWMGVSSIQFYFGFLELF